MHILRALLVGLLLTMAAGMAAIAAETEVDLELVLAVDVSRSIDEVEAELQRRGYLEALVDPRVVEAIKAGPKGRIAITYVEWAGQHYQQTIIGWMLIDGPESAKVFADKLAEAPRVSESWTSISSAILYCAALFNNNGYDGKRRVIDVSGDGRNNAGPDMESSRAEVLGRGITINGLPIMSDRPNFGRPPDTELDIYYEREVIGGPGAFMVVARDFGDFARAIRTKLIKEISGIDAPARGAADQAAR